MTIRSTGAVSRRTALAGLGAGGLGHALATGRTVTATCIRFEAPGFVAGTPGASTPTA